MGGRGGSSGGGGGAGTSRNATGNARKEYPIPKMTSAQVDKLSRSQLETVATAIYANNASKRGLSLEEGARRARLLLQGNTNAQLRKFIKRNK